MLILTLARLNNERSEALASSAWLCCMDSHDPVRIVFTPARQFWRAFAYVMQVHENHHIKRAGVAGIRARGNMEITLNLLYTGGILRGVGAIMTFLHLVADHLVKQANTTRKKGVEHTILADAYGRSAFNRYYYACFLNVREFVSTIDTNWGKVKHAEVPTLLRVSVNKKIEIELRKSERIGDLTPGEYQSKKSMLLTSLDNMASTMALAYTIRGVVDYEPEIEMIFGEGTFSINKTSVASAKGWLQTINSERSKVIKIMREVGFV